MCILDPHNGFANSCRRSKPDIFEFNSGPVHTKPVVSEAGHVVTRIRVDGVIQCFYRDFVHWGQQDSVYTNPVIFEIANIVTTESLQCSYQDFVPWGPHAHREAKRGP